MHKKRHRFNFNLVNFQLERPGTYWFILESEQSGSWQFAAKLPLDVTLGPPPIVIPKKQ
jgi:hypothetical protein